MGSALLCLQDHVWLPPGLHRPCVRSGRRLSHHTSVAGMRVARVPQRIKIWASVLLMCWCSTVFERIMATEGAELEILIGLSSQICKVIPEHFAQELEHGQIKERFVKRLVDALKTNMKPAAHCSGIRSVIVEQAIYMMRYSSRYSNLFNQCCMMEALLMVEETPSMAKNYRRFLGDAGFMNLCPLLWRSLNSC